MTDLREAAEMALDYIRREGWTNSQGKEVFIALSQALAMERFSEVNQEIEEALKQPKQKPAACEHEWVRKSGMLPGDWFCICCGEWKYRTAPVDAVNMSQERVDETAKRKHEWVGLTDEEFSDLLYFDGRLDCVEVPLIADLIRAAQAKLKEKNGYE